MDYANWFTNLQGIMKPLSFNEDVKVHGGILDAYVAMKDEIRDSVRSYLHKHPSANIFVTGHSLGGALADLAAADIKYHMKSAVNKVYLYTYGAPRVGNEAWANAMFEMFPRGYHYRLVNLDD